MKKFVLILLSALLFAILLACCFSACDVMSGAAPTYRGMTISRTAESALFPASYEPYLAAEEGDATEGDATGNASDEGEEARRIMFDLDFEFHSRIMRLSGNTLIESLIPLVLEFFSSQLQRYTRGESVQTRAAGYQEHFGMVEALKRRDLPALQSVIRSHIHGYIASAGKDGER